MLNPAEHPGSQRAGDAQDPTEINVFREGSASSRILLPNVPGRLTHPLAQQIFTKYQADARGNIKPLDSHELHALVGVNRQSVHLIFM